MKCAYCSQSVDSPFVGIIDGEIFHFCDILCASLYNSHRHKIIPMMDAYNRLYCKNKLQNRAKIIYERLSEYGNFYMIPICTESSSPADTKKAYKQKMGLYY